MQGDELGCGFPQGKPQIATSPVTASKKSLRKAAFRLQEMLGHMTLFKIQQLTAVWTLSMALSVVPSLAQATNAKPASPAETPVAGKVVEDIVARVNDQIITQSDYDRAAEQLTAEAGQQAIPPRELEQKKADLLRDLIDQQLLLSKGKELGITGETELIKRLDEIRWKTWRRLRSSKVSPMRTSRRTSATASSPSK
jgi:hypothetical protein